MTTTATATPISVSAKTVAKGGWYAIVLLFAIDFLNFFDRFVPSVYLSRSEMNSLSTTSRLASSPPRSL
jgi:hypothetical protein